MTWETAYLRRALLHETHRQLRWKAIQPEKETTYALMKTARKHTSRVPIWKPIFVRTQASIALVFVYLTQFRMAWLGCCPTNTYPTVLWTMNFVVGKILWRISALSLIDGWELIANLSMENDSEFFNLDVEFKSQLQDLPHKCHNSAFVFVSIFFCEF